LAHGFAGLCNSDDIGEDYQRRAALVFSRAELIAISEALATYRGEAADAVRLIMLTGCRPNEALQAKGEEMDAEPGYWIKPSNHVKQRRQHKLPLNPAALELIERLRKGDPWLRRSPFGVFKVGGRCVGRQIKD
jgi:integrase